jgi:hypothetical protein
MTFQVFCEFDYVWLGMTGAEVKGGCLQDMSF